jgi:PIN domain nuclease of toxin-antitoxin system
MSAVLDTHTVLWYLENSKELSPVARTKKLHLTEPF